MKDMEVRKAPKCFIGSVSSVKGSILLGLLKSLGISTVMISVEMDFETWPVCQLFDKILLDSEF